MKKLLIGILVLSIAMMSVAAVSAQEDDPTVRPPRDGILAQIMEITGLDIETIRQGAQDGLTFAEMIEANGGDVEAVKAELVALAIEKLPDAEAIEERIDNLMNSVPGENLKERREDRRDRREDRRENRPNPRQLIETVIEITGLDAETIREGFQNGDSLAVMIEANGGDVEAVVTELTARVTEQFPELDAEKVSERITNMLNRVPGENLPDRPRNAPNSAGGQA